MNLAHDVVQHGFAGTIGTHRERALLHATNAAEGRAERDEFGLLGFFQKRLDCLEEEQGSIGIGLDVVLEGSYGHRG